MDTDRDYKVYIHTNNINGKKYVGLTRQEPRKRWGTYGSKCPIGAAFAKYGRDNFTSEVVLEGLTKEEAEEAEIRLIKENGSLTSEWGYNVEKGGSARGRVSDETKEKLRESQHQRWVKDYDGMYALSNSETAKAKRAKSLQEAAKRPETKKALSAALKKRWAAPEYRDKMRALAANALRSKRVVCDGVVYNGALEFIKENGLEESPATIRSWLNGKRTMPDEWYKRGLMLMGDEDKRVVRSESGDLDLWVDGLHFTKLSYLSRYLGILDSTLSRYIYGKRKCPQALLDRGLRPINLTE